MQLFDIFKRVDQEWTSLASHYAVDLKIDRHWNWKKSAPLMTLIASGPVQKVLRIGWTGEHSDTGKTFLTRCHHLVCEKQGRILRCWIDGELVVEYQEPFQALTGEYIGFYIDSAGQIDNVKVYTKNR
ncbi:MAG: hypothetical protein GX902_01165 [Lentisphaerae bacterium]|nr:hypothetical protein [Lentisphaerota bacterium]